MYYQERCSYRWERSKPCKPQFSLRPPGKEDCPKPQLNDIKRLLGFFSPPSDFSTTTKTPLTNFSQREASLPRVLQYRVTFLIQGEQYVESKFLKKIGLWERSTTRPFMITIASSGDRKSKISRGLPISQIHILFLPPALFLLHHLFHLVDFILYDALSYVDDISSSYHLHIVVLSRT